MYSLRVASSLLLAASCLPITSVPTLAGALPPIITASQSANGRFLVVVDYEYEKSDGGPGRRVLSTTYRVMGAKDCPNWSVCLSAPGSFWFSSASDWEVRLEAAEGYFWPMVSDDGEWLVLVGVTEAVPGPSILRIYRTTRWNGGSPQLVRSYQITDLWTPQQINPDGKGIFVVSDATPLWFARGRLSFSDDGQQLIYRNQWNETLSINLRDGVISRAKN